MPCIQSQITVNNKHSIVRFLPKVKQSNCMYQQDGVSQSTVVSYLCKLLEGFRRWNTIKIKQSSASDGGRRLVLKSVNVVHLSLTMSVNLSVHISSNNKRITAAWIFMGLNILEFH